MIEHTPVIAVGDWRTNWLMIPHECSDPQCPGNVNRRKLAAFDGLLAACEALMDRAQHDDECSLYGPRINGCGDCTCFLVEVCAAIASAKEQTAPEPLEGARADGSHGGTCDD